MAYFGGTFDPIHEGHLHLARSAQQHYQFERFLFVPTELNPNKSDQIPTEGRYRLEMLKNAIGKEPFEILDWELQQSGPNFTFNTVTRLLQLQPNIAVCLILGNDVFRDLPAWFQFRSLLKQVHLIVATRDHKQYVDLEQFVKDNMIEGAHISKDKNRIEHSGGSQWIEKFQFSPLPFSATALRKQIATQWVRNDMAHPPQGIQRSVWKVIKDHHLYTR